MLFEERDLWLPCCLLMVFENIFPQRTIIQPACALFSQNQEFLVPLKYRPRVRKS